jgi:hypothetical protein
MVAAASAMPARRMGMICNAVVRERGLMGVRLPGNGHWYNAAAHMNG